MFFFFFSLWKSPTFFVESRVFPLFFFWQATWKKLSLDNFWESTKIKLINQYSITFHFIIIIIFLFYSIANATNAVWKWGTICRNKLSFLQSTYLFILSCCFHFGRKDIVIVVGFVFGKRFGNVAQFDGHFNRSESKYSYINSQSSTQMTGTS